jgi:transmembrane sensor
MLFCTARRAWAKSNNECDASAPPWIARSTIIEAGRGVCVCLPWVPIMTGEPAPIPSHIADEAATWIMRMESGPLAPNEELELEQWRAADPRHDRALARLAGLWREMDAVAPGTLGLPPARQRRRARVRTPAVERPSRRRWQRPAIAAGLCLALLAGTGGNRLALWVRADHQTAPGERAHLRLADGSAVDLDGDSAIAVEFSANRRRVTLLGGQAAFDVASDPARPFVVDAAGGSATALGTAFIVRKDREGVRVVVTRHRVAVRHGGGQGPATVLPEGMAVRYDAQGVQKPVSIDPSAEAAWMRGKLIVVDRPLREVVEEIARHRYGWIGVSGNTANLRVSGVFDLDDPLTAIDALQKTMGLTSYRLTNRVILLHR